FEKINKGIDIDEEFVDLLYDELVRLLKSNTIEFEKLQQAEICHNKRMDDYIKYDHPKDCTSNKNYNHKRLNFFGAEVVGVAEGSDVRDTYLLYNPIKASIGEIKRIGLASLFDTVGAQELLKSIDFVKF